MKKLAAVAVVAGFIGYWMYTDPAGLADITTNGATHGLDIAGQAAHAVIDFVEQVA
jgi:hypothetical protein